MSDETLLRDAPPQDEVQLPLEMRAVDIEQGRNVYEYTHSALETIEAKELQALPLGEETRQVFGELLSNLRNDPNKLMIFDNDIGAFHPAQQVIAVGSNMPIGYKPAESISMSPGIAADYKPKIEKAFADAAVVIDPEMLDGLTVQFLVSHEVGHVLQHAHRIVSFRHNQDKEDANLSTLAMKQGVVRPHPALQIQPDYSPSDKVAWQFHADNVDKERFAEGFAAMVLGERVGVLLGLDELSRERLDMALHTMRAVDIEPVSKVIEESNGSFDKLFRSLKANSIGLNNIGYGSPHTTQVILETIRLTG